MQKKDVYNLTTPQKSIWYIEQYYKGSTLNNIAGRLYIDEQVDFDLFKKAINIFVRDNDAFRIKLFYDNNSKIKQYFSDYEYFDIDIVSLNNIDEVSSLEKQMCDAPFTLINSKLFNFKVFRLPNGKGGLVLVAHHLIYDAYTASLTANKIVSIYTSLLHNENIKELPTSYLNYINSENEYFLSNKYDKDKEFWNEFLKTIPEPGVIPGINQIKEDSCRALRKSFIISKELNRQINEFCKEHKISAFNFFMALYSIYISRVSSLDDFVIGTPILNRSNYIEKNTPGMFISTIPVKISINNNQQFSDFAQKIGADFFTMFRHQKYSYQTILEDIRKKFPKQQNLYNIIISYQNAKTTKKVSDIPFEIKWLFNNNLPENMQISLSDLNDDGILIIDYDYKTSIYTEKDITLIHNRILHMINQILQNQTVDVENIEITTLQEKSKILRQFNNTSFKYDKKKTVIDYFEYQVKKTPNSVALVCNNQSLTYKELNEKANQLANFLIKHNVKHKDFVGIMIHRSCEMVIGIIAILKAGATYLPIDPVYPKERITYMLENSNCNTILVCNDTYNLIDNKYNKINIALDKLIYNSKKTKNLNTKILPHDLIYMIYTSGSTGNPKGVMITHQNINNFVLAEKQHINFLPNKVMVSVTTICFDIFALELWCSLTSGMKLVLANDNEQMSPIALKNLCIKHNVNMIQTTPSRLSVLLSYNKDLSFLSNFTDIMVGGEAFPKEWLEKLQNNTKANIFNMYGPTETTVWSTIKDLTKAKEINIGKPLANTTCYILDSNKKLLPPFVPGELYIGGDGVSKGYWGKNELTKKNFISSPFDNNSTIYNTGDLAYFTDEGEIVHLGRTDFQVKIRGYRVELEEIEAKITNYLEISSCIVNAIENSTKLCAYYTAKNEIDQNKLRRFLMKQLPNYMVPNYFVRMETFPYTPNGKINRKALPKPKQASAKKIISKRNDIDNFIITELENVLNINNISISDTFFELGADSLVAIDLSTKISNKYNIDFSVKDIFENPIIKSLSDAIASKLENRSETTIPKADLKEEYYVSSSQRQIYYASNKAGKDSLVYNMPGVISFNKKPDIQKLKNAFNSLISRHSSLRTYFVIKGNDVYQSILKNITFELIEEVTDNSEENIIKSFIKPFDLSKPPLFRAKLVTFKNKVLLLFDMHHIISDGFSISILAKELSALYNLEELKPISIDYTDYAEWQFKKLAANSFNESKEYWINNMQNNIPILNMPTDYARPANISNEGAKIHKTIDSSLLREIITVAKNCNVSTYVFMLAVYFVLLSKYTYQEDIIVGTPTIGRDNKQLSNIIGMFVNTLPIKAHIDISTKFIDFLNSIKHITIEGIKHQEYPFEELINNLNLPQDNSRNPLFDTMFIYQNAGYQSLNFSGLDATVKIPDINISKFDFSLEVIPTEDKLILNIEYCTKLFSKDTIENLANHYINILQNVVNNVNTKINEIEVLSIDEKNKILYGFNNTQKDFPNNKTIIDLFEEQVEKSPNNIALVFEDTSLTFKELNDKANMLAWHMKKNGLGRGDTVSIMINRSLELLVAILASLKCGSCYIPIDPNFPRDRVQYMLTNSNSKLLLTDKKLYNEIEYNNKLAIDLLDYNFEKCTQNPPHVNIPYDTSFIIYTSGSTGNPKGVMLSHGSFSNLIFDLNESVAFFNTNTPITIGSVTTASFDIFTFETLISLQAGLKVAIANEDEQRLPSKFNDFLKRNDIKAIQMTPSRMQLFIDSIKECPELTNLDYVVLAGEPLPNSLLNSLLQLGVKKVYNGYGPSETTVFATFTDVTKYKNVNIGRPIANTQIYILDNNLLPVPIGVPGELYISGAGVGKGYLNNLQKTKESFINNPFTPNSLMYKTGDIGKFLKNGEISYLERVDNQVKIRGLRIELEEIESKLLEISGIEKVKVVKQSFENRDFLSAYYISNFNITADSIRTILSKTLPSFMIPSYFTRVDEFPYTPNGKIDKNMLPFPDSSSASTKSKYVEPETDIEIRLVSILEDLLKVKRISVLDNFLNLGGDSLVTIVLCTRIKQEFNVQLSFKDVLNNPIIKDLANIISNASNDNSILSIPKCSLMDYYPVSSAQKRIYMACKMLENSSLYNISGNVLLDSLPNIDKLQSALNTIVKRHEVLRTSFDIINGNIVQKINQNLSIKINVVEAETDNIQKIFNKYKSVFDLSVAPLFKVFLFKLPSNKALLMLDTHHIIFDGTSLNNLLTELTMLYNGKELENLQISYRDFAVWEQNKLKSNSFDESKNYWINLFKDMPSQLHLPTTFKRPITKSYEGDTYVLTLNEKIVKQINSFSNKHNVTPYMLMLSVYYILLYLYTNQEDIVVGTPVSGRIYKELEPLLGVFINSLPLRNTFKGDNTFNELLLKVKVLCTNAFSHQEYPFDELISSLNIPRDISRSPLFDTMFIYQNNGFANIEPEKIGAKLCTINSHTSKYDITLEVLPIEDVFTLSFEYCTQLFDKNFIIKFAENYKKILNTIFLKPDIRIKDISLLDFENKILKQIPSSDIKKQTTTLIAPSTTLEMQIEDIFKKVLSIKTIGIDENFFELGGNSLLAINLQIELLKQKINVTYPDIFMAPTIRKLAQKISSNKLQTTYTLSTKDFEKYALILDNTCNFKSKIKKSTIGNILLTGVTGFLGSHILDAFLKNEAGIAYCMIRPENSKSIEEKLINTLHYYFGYKYDYCIGTRIIPISSDITNSNLGLSLLDEQCLASDISCIVNCAAKVTHYGEYNAYKEVNVDATEKLLEFSLKYNKKFYQISTTSISGVTLENSEFAKYYSDKNIIFKENNFYIGQSLENVYVRSKFEAEKIVLDYILKGLDAYIFRVGNLMNRYEDGKFQPNVSQNAFINRLSSLSYIGCVPEYLINNYLEFTPIDSCALAVIKLMQSSNEQNRIFHLYNHHNVNVKEFIDLLKEYTQIDIVPNEDFIKEINNIVKDEDSNTMLAGVLRDFDADQKLEYDSKIKIKSFFTINYLMKLDFIWPRIDHDYLIKFIEYFNNLGLLKKKGE